MVTKSSDSLLTVARMYYVQGETMDAIAHHLSVSRSTVSRLLKEARDRGLVRVTIVDPERPLGRMADLFQRYFNVTAHIVQVRPGASGVFRLDQVSRTAAAISARERTSSGLQSPSRTGPATSTRLSEASTRARMSSLAPWVAS